MGNTTTNGTLLQTSGNETHYAVLWANMLAEVLSKQRQSFLNVSTATSAISIFITLVKNAFVSYGISTIISELGIIQILITFTLLVLVHVAGSYVLNLSIIWSTWAAFLCFNTPINELPAIARFLISLAILSLVPIFFPIYSQAEVLLDIICIIYLTRHLLDVFWGETALNFFGDVFLLFTCIIVGFAIDAYCRAQGLCFEALILIFLFFPLIIKTFVDGDILYLAVMSCLFVCFMHEIMKKIILNQIT